MRILMVGAGSVGQVYGWHLARGGAEVHVFVKPTYADEAREGFRLYPPKSATPDRFVPSGVVTSAAEVARTSWEQVWLAIPSDALRGPWLSELIGAIGDAVLVSLLPGLRDRGILTPLVPPERLVVGLITFSAWHAPLPGESLPDPGMAWWLPPLTPSLFEGPPGAVATIVKALRAGGCPAAKGKATEAAARGSSFLVPVVAAMECGGWTFAGLREDRWAKLAADAAKEALAVSCAHLAVSPGAAGLAMRPGIIRLATRVVPRLAPMDFEAFLHVHFAKVDAQTQLALDTWVEEGEGLQLPVARVRELARELRRKRGN